MTEAIKNIILNSLKLKEASIKRAMTSAEPRFKAVYDAELGEVHDAQKWVGAQKVTA